MMHAQVLPASYPESIRMAAAIIRAGGIVAFPTETVYGLGADALNPDAVARVFETKQRPPFDPCIVHIATRASLDFLAQTIGLGDGRLMERFWPGPLTLVLPKRERVPDIVTAGLPTIAIRMPAHPVAQALIREAGTPIAAPSANSFGCVSPTTAQHVFDGLGDKVDLILDGGPCPIGVESTIVSLAGVWPQLLRPGAISYEEIKAVIGPIERPPERPPDREDTPVAPGLLARHYATRTPLSILPFRGAQPPLCDGERAGLLAFSAPVSLDGYWAVEVLSTSGDLVEIARNLFAALHRLDALGLDSLYTEPCEECGLGLAIMDRLRRGAAPQTAEANRLLNSRPYMV